MFVRRQSLRTLHAFLMISCSTTRLLALLSAFAVGTIRAEQPVPPARLTFALLSRTPLEFDVSTWPAEVRSLADREVRLTGYLLPLTTAGGRTREFLLMRSQNACCFGKMPAPNEFVVVHAVEPGLAVVMDVPVTVSGLLRLNPLGPEGAVAQLFSLDAAKAL
jgi:hypothetical protein